MTTFAAPGELTGADRLVIGVVSLGRCECRRTESMTVNYPARWKNTGVLLPPGWGIYRWASAITTGN